MQLVWRPTCSTIHEIKRFHLFDEPLVWQPKKPFSVFQKGLYYRGFCWLCIARRCQFYIDKIQKCTIVFKLKIFNLHIQDLTYKMLFCIYLPYLSYIYLCYYNLFKQRAVIAYFTSLYLSIYLLFSQKDKGTFDSLQENKKVQHTIKFLSSREHPKSTFMLCCSCFYAVQLFFIFEICK